MTQKEYKFARYSGKVGIALLAVTLFLIAITNAAAFVSDEAAGKINDEAFADLTMTELGQQTLTAADATDDLIAKQAKLAQKWGAGKVDEVVSKGWKFWQPDRAESLNKILKAMPENLVDDLSPEKAVKFLGDKKLVEAAEDVAKGVDSTVILNAVGDVGGYEKLLEYAKAVRKLDSAIVNPLEDIGKHQVLKISKNANLKTKVGDTTIDGMAVLKKGVQGEKGWGYLHIIEAHEAQFKKLFGKQGDEISSMITDVVKTGTLEDYIPGKEWRIVKDFKTVDDTMHKVRVVVSDIDDPVSNVFSRGSIQTAHPI